MSPLLAQSAQGKKGDKEHVCRLESSFSPPRPRTLFDCQTQCILREAGADGFEFVQTRSRIESVVDAFGRFFPILAAIAFISSPRKVVMFSFLIPDPEKSFGTLWFRGIQQICGATRKDSWSLAMNRESS